MTKYFSRCMSAGDDDKSQVLGRARLAGGGRQDRSTLAPWCLLDTQWRFFVVLVRIYSSSLSSSSRSSTSSSSSSSSSSSASSSSSSRALRSSSRFLRSASSLSLFSFSASSNIFFSASLPASQVSFMKASASSTESVTMILSKMEPALTCHSSNPTEPQGFSVVQPRSPP